MNHKIASELLKVAESLTAGLKSRKQLYEDLKDINESGIAHWPNPFSNYKKMRNEIYGRKAMIYVKWASPADRKEGEQELRYRGYKIHRYDVPSTSEVQVSYFKGRHWDE